MLNPQRHKCVRYNRRLGAETSVGHLYMQLQMRKYYEKQHLCSEGLQKTTVPVTSNRGK